MAKKWLFGLAAVVVALSVGAIGFAAFSSSVTINGSAGAGSLVLVFTGSYSASPTPSGYASCTVSFSTSQVANIYATDLAPGQYCTFSLQVENTGNIPITNEMATFAYGGTGSYCNTGGQINCIWVQDGIGMNTETGAYTSTDTTTINPGAGYNYVVYTTLPSGSTDQTTSLTFSITLTGSD